MNTCKDSRSEYDFNANYRPTPRYIQKAMRNNKEISAALPWFLLLASSAFIGILLAWRG